MEFRYYNPQKLVDAHPEGGLIFLMRHAERYPFVQPEDVLLVGLTEDGIQQAHQSGETLGKAYRIRHMAASPLERCIDTGRYLLNGAQESQPIHGHWWLFSPFLRNRKGQGIEFWPARAVDHPKSIYLPERLEILLRRMAVQVQKGEIALFIAHDTTILPLLAYLLGETRVDESQMPGFTEGIALVRRNGKLSLTDPAEYRYV